MPLVLKSVQHPAFEVMMSLGPRGLPLQPLLTGGTGSALVALRAR